MSQESKVLARLMGAHNRLNRSETTAQEFEEYALGLLSDLARSQRKRATSTTTPARNTSQIGEG